MEKQVTGRESMRRRTRGMSIRAKILLPATILIILLCVVLGMCSYVRLKEGLVAMGVEEARMAAVVSAKVVDGEKVKELKPGDEESVPYQAQLSVLKNIRDDCGIKYLYTLYTDGSQVYYGIDTDESESNQSIGNSFETSYQELQGVFSG